MKLKAFWALGLLGLITLSLAFHADAGPSGSPLPGDHSWMKDPIWDDGQAEYAVYEATWPRYGSLYSGRVHIIAVKEAWAPELDVKADRPRPDGFDVLKMNFLREVQTGIYRYNQMSSVFVRRDEGSLRKYSATSFEACGLSHATMTQGKLSTQSYFDGQGDRLTDFPEAASPEDGLALTARSFLAGSLPKTVALHASLLAGRFPALGSWDYQLSRHDAGMVTVPAGSFDCTEIRFQRGSTQLSYFFAKKSPHVMVRHQNSDGSDYRLAKVERIRYWEMAAPEHEAWLPKNLR